MKTRLVILICSIFISSCAGYFDILAKNRNNLLSLSPGMSKQEVLSVMGTKTELDTRGVRFNNPYRVDSVQLDNGDYIEIIFYHTEEKNGNILAVSDDELTPLVLKNSKLIGWGWTFLNQNTYKSELRFR